MVYLKPLILGLKSWSGMFDHMFHLPKKWVKYTEKNTDFGNHFQKAWNLLAKLVHTIFFHEWMNEVLRPVDIKGHIGRTSMHTLPKTHGVYMYGCSPFIASTAEA